MKRIGFVTSQEDPELIGDDHLMFPFLKTYGFLAAPLVWDRPGSLKTMDYDALIFRSCWNYHRKYPEFLGWLDDLKQIQIPILNPLKTIKWNLNKKHILEFEGLLSVPKTKWLASKTPFSPQTLNEIRIAWQVDQLVIKPAVSLNGEDTYLVGLEDLERAEMTVSTLLENRDVLIQEYIPEIKTEGEISLIYFSRTFSHSVRKIPAAGEFRVHREYGGSREPIKASPQALNYGQAVLDQIEGELLYARVDLVEASTGPILIELELTDPMLYLQCDAHAAQNFAQAIAALI